MELTVLGWIGMGVWTLGYLFTMLEIIVLSFAEDTDLNDKLIGLLLGGVATLLGAYPWFYIYGINMETWLRGLFVQ